MSGLMPTREEWRKLLFEGWKWLLGVLLLGIASLVPAVRSWCAWAGGAIGNFATSEVVVRGVLLIILAAFALAGLVAVARWVARRLGPKYVRCFREGEYDGIIWRWKWRRGAVTKTSMKPYCSVDGTGLVTSHVAGGTITLGIVTKTRIDTYMFCPTCNKSIGFANVEDLPEYVRLKIEGDAMRRTWNVPQGRVPEKLRRR